MHGFGGPAPGRSPNRLLLACCLTLAALADEMEEEMSATPWLEEPVAVDVTARVPVYWGIVATHAAGLLFVSILLCSWAHEQPAALPLVLLGAAWFTALDWAGPIASLELVNAGWLYRIVAPPSGLPECGELSTCMDVDAARAAGPGVLVCAVAVCAPPAEYLAAIGDCRLPHDATPTQAEQKREMYVRLQAGDGITGGVRAVVKTKLATSAMANYDFDWPATTLKALLEEKQALVRVLKYAIHPQPPTQPCAAQTRPSRSLSPIADWWLAGVLSRSGAQAIGWTPKQRLSLYATIRQKQVGIDVVREQRLAGASSRCVVLPTRPMRVRADVVNFNKWGEDEHLGSVTLPSLQAWTGAANCGNFGQPGTVIMSGNGYTIATCQAACDRTVGCHAFYHGVDSGDEPGSCVIRVGNTEWACLFLPSNKDYLAYTVGTVGSAPMFDEWLNLAPEGVGINGTTRCTNAPCVRLTVYDDLWAQFNLYDADTSGESADSNGSFFSDLS